MNYEYTNQISLLESDEKTPEAENVIPWEVNAEKREQSEKALWRWNMLCFIAHLIQAVICLRLGVLSGYIGDFKLPLTTLFLSYPNGYPQQDLQQKALLPFVAVTSAFSFLSAAAHLLVLVNFEVYLRDLRRGLNQYRWVEYSLSSSLMIGLIAMLFGMYDIISLVLIMSVNACMNFFGYIMEILNEGRSKEEIDWTPFYFGCFAGVVPWACIFAYIGGSPTVKYVPNFVWGALVTYFVMFNTFPINMFLQYKKVSYWSDERWGFRMAGYYYGERIYQILSLVAKSALLWLVVGGSNQPNPVYK